MLTVICVPSKADVMQSGRIVCLSFCVCVQDYCNSNQPISLKLSIMIKHYINREN